MRMKLLALLLFLFLVHPVMAADFELKQNKDGVHFKSINQPLSKVLQSIGEKSGIKFSLREELNETPVTVEISAPDWKALVKKLLRDFSKVELWNEKIAGSKIKITGIGQYVPASSASRKVVGKAAPAERRASLEPKGKKRWVRPPPLPKPEEIYPDHPLAKLPSHVFMEPAIMNYLLDSNVDIPDEFKKKYGLPIDGEEEGRSHYTKRRSLPIPKEIYEDPAFDEYLSQVGLSKPPQIPLGFEKIDPLAERRR